MDPSHITPFITSVQNVFSTMLQLPVEVREPHLKREPKATHDVTAIIGMSGDVRGSVALGFPGDTAERVVALFVGAEVARDSADFADAVGELANMICGGAKAMFPDNGGVSISVPSVVVGAGHTVAQQTDTPCVVIPCDTDCGELMIEIAIRPSTTKDSAKAAAGARANA